MPFALRHTDIRIQAEGVWLDALLSSAPDVHGLLIFAVPYLTPPRESHENHAADVLRTRGYATLLVSLLTPYEEARDPDVRFDISLLSQRLQALVAWMDQQPDLAGLPLGLLCADTVAAAAIRYLVREPDRVAALATLSGRADLAGADPLRRLDVPTLMLLPATVADLGPRSAQAHALLTCEKSWLEIEGAGVRFTEAGALETALDAAGAWFVRHLPPRTPRVVPATVAESADVSGA